MSDAIRASIDPALDTARDMLDGTVCICGHCDADHIEVDGAYEECAEDCACELFEPAKFTVERVS